MPESGIIFNEDHPEYVGRGFTIVPQIVELAGNTNDLDIDKNSRLRFYNTSGGSVNLTGFTGEDDGHQLFVRNMSVNNVVLKHNDSNSALGNRLYMVSGADITLGYLRSMVFDYVDDGTIKGWVQIGLA